MDLQGKTPAMNQKIFELGLNVETVSLYLLCCGIVDAGESISSKNIENRWNSTREGLSKGLKELEDRRILKKILSNGEGSDVFKLADVKKWKLS